MADVFISYSTDDTELAEEICRFLEKKDINCWIAPRNIPPGSDYTTAIPNAIENCSYLLLVLTPSAQNSQWVEKEVLSAMSKKKTVIPFVAERFEISKNFGFILNNAQWEDGSDDWIVALDRIAGSIKKKDINKEEKKGTKEENKNNPPKNKVYPRVKKPECPKCGSAELQENDYLVIGSNLLNGFELLTDRTLLVGGLGIILPLLTYILYKYPVTSKYVLKAISFIPFLGDFIISGDSVGGRLFLIGVIMLALFYIIIGVTFLLKYATTSKYSKIVEAQCHEVEYTCRKCAYKFTKSYTPDEARLRSEQAKNNKFNLATATGLYLGFVIMIVVLYVTRKILLRIFLWIIMLIILVNTMVSLAFFAVKEVIKYKKSKKSWIE